MWFITTLKINRKNRYLLFIMYHNHLQISMYTPFLCKRNQWKVISISLNLDSSPMPAHWRPGKVLSLLALSYCGTLTLLCSYLHRVLSCRGCHSQMCGQVLYCEASFWSWSQLRIVLLLSCNIVCSKKFKMLEIITWALSLKRECAMRYALHGFAKRF